MKDRSHVPNPSISPSAMVQLGRGEPDGLVSCDRHGDQTWAKVPGRLRDQLGMWACDMCLADAVRAERRDAEVAAEEKRRLAEAARAKRKAELQAARESDEVVRVALRRVREVQDHVDRARAEHKRGSAKLDAASRELRSAENALRRAEERVRKASAEAAKVEREHGDARQTVEQAQDLIEEALEPLREAVSASIAAWRNVPRVKRKAKKNREVHRQAKDALKKGGA